MTAKTVQGKAARPSYPAETRASAVQEVLDVQDDHPSLWAAVTEVAPRVGCAPKTLLEWVQDSGLLQTVDSRLLSNRKRLAALSKAELELENQRLRAENDVLRQACVIFARGPAGGGF
ncbi:transposase [Paracoccus zeaxanthinifaciens]|uniref:transposase n=1 Tax=Paracoccus zeaxanthinifaciens TaxID=187400 RepID=UPI0003B6D55D|nr:transposase [Paracoccus zeaxanthinifaciens]